METYTKQYIVKIIPLLFPSEKETRDEEAAKGPQTRRVRGDHKRGGCERDAGSVKKPVSRVRAGVPKGH